MDERNSEKIMATNLPTLRQLEYVVAVAQHGQFGRAAKDCAVSQPALSKQIQEVERHLGAPLFERTRPKVLLTPLGKEVVRRAQQLLLDAHELMRLADELKGMDQGRLQMGVIPTISPYVLPPLWLKMQAHYPGLEIILQEEQTETLIDSLLSGQLDVALVALPIPQHGLQALPLFDEPFVLAVPEGHPLDQPGMLDESMLSEHAIILMGEGHCLRDHALSVCSSEQRRSAEIQASSVTTLVLMVQAGLGATLLPLSCLPTELPKAPNIKLRLFQSRPQPKRTIGLLWRPTTARKALYERIGHCLCAIVDELEQQICDRLAERHSQWPSFQKHLGRDEKEPPEPQPRRS